MNNGIAPLFMLCTNERNITMKATIPQNPSFRCECASSPTRNKAKNALSLAATISPVLAGAKIGKSFDSTIRSGSKFLLDGGKRDKSFTNLLEKPFPFGEYWYFCGEKKKIKYDTNIKNYSLVMFNRVAQIDMATTRNIRDIMSRSKKRTPASTCCCCKSQKRGKQFCNRKFRRRERMMMGKGQYDRLPNKPIEVTDPWDLGGNGKTFWEFSPNEDWFIRLMRK
jgi:hypothetical protein